MSERIGALARVRRQAERGRNHTYAALISPDDLMAVLARLDEAESEIAESIDREDALRQRTLERTVACQAAHEALRPFADAYEFWNAADGGIHDSNEIDDQGMITAGDLRRASEVLRLNREPSRRSGLGV